MNIIDKRLANLVRYLGLEDGIAAFELITITGAENITDAATIATAWHASHVRRARQKLEIS